MLNDKMPKYGKNFPDSIKLRSGDSFKGVIVSGEMISTGFGDTAKFTFEDVEGKQKVLLTKSLFLISKINEFNPGDLIKIIRTGEGRETRWIIEVG